MIIYKFDRSSLPILSRQPHAFTLALAFSSLSLSLSCSCFFFFFFFLCGLCVFDHASKPRSSSICFFFLEIPIKEEDSKVGLFQFNSLGSIIQYIPSPLFPINKKSCLFVGFQPPPPPLLSLPFFHFVSTFLTYICRLPFPPSF